MAATSNISVGYLKTGIDHQLTLTRVTSNDGSKVFLAPDGTNEGYYNIIPNGNPVKISVSMSSTNSGSLSRTLQFQTGGTYIPFSAGTRYKLLPAAGLSGEAVEYKNYKPTNVGSWGCYWSSTPDSSSDRAWRLHFNSSNASAIDDYIHNGNLRLFEE